MVGTGFDQSQGLLAMLGGGAEITAVVAAVLNGVFAKEIEKVISKRSLLMCAAAGLGVCLGMLVFAQPVYSLGGLFLLRCYLLFLAMCLGIVLGTYGAVEFALALNLIPNKDNSATLLGMWAIIRFLGESVGGAVMGVCLEGFRNNKDAAGVIHYGLDGYGVVVVGIVLGAANVTILLSRIPKSSSMPLSVGRSVTVENTMVRSASYQTV